MSLVSVLLSCTEVERGVLDFKGGEEDKEGVASLKIGSASSMIGVIISEVGVATSGSEFMASCDGDTESESGGVVSSSP